MKTLLDLYEAAVSTLWVGIVPNSVKDYSSLDSDKKISELFKDIATDEQVSLNNKQEKMLLDTIKAEISGLRESELYNDFGSKLEEVELTFK